MCVSSCLFRSCSRGNDCGHMGHGQRFTVVVTGGGVMGLWNGEGSEDDPAKSGCGWVETGSSVSPGCSSV